MTDASEGRFDPATDFAYYDQDARDAAAELPPAERQQRISRMLIRSPAFNATVAAMRDFHMPVRGGTPDRGKVCGILGPSRVGKSWAIEHYVRHLGNVETDEAVIPRAVYVDVHNGWNSASFAKAAHVAARLPAGVRGNAVAMLEAVAGEVSYHGVELVIVDDVQFLLEAKDVKTIKEVQGFLISVAEKARCNVILAGTHSIQEAVRAVDHLYGRGLFPVRSVPAFDWRYDETLGGFGSLLDEIDDRLPFRLPSDLSAPEVAAHLYRLSGGLIGWVKVYVEEAAHLAINDGADRITVDHLHAAAQSHRAVDDPYDPFRTAVDISDPLGAARERDRASLELVSEMPPTLDRRRRKHWKRHEAA